MNKTHHNPHNLFVITIWFIPVYLLRNHYYFHTSSNFVITMIAICLQNFQVLIDHLKTIKPHDNTRNPPICQHATSIDCSR